jgi:hypothetical protein
MKPRLSQLDERLPTEVEATRTKFGRALDLFDDLAMPEKLRTKTCGNHRGTPFAGWITSMARV